MSQTMPLMNIDLAGLDMPEWLERLEDMAEDAGFFEPLGPDHQATFVKGNGTLVVTFEDAATIRNTQAAQPMGFDFVAADGWSHLCIISNAESWFRHPAIYGFFDRMIDDGFFDDFDQVLFTGSGAAGYAAAAYSVASPGATVVAIRPQATLDPSVVFWDTRFTKHRRLNFTDRYGYAPDMIDAARQVYVVYSPVAKADAIHASLFTRQNVTKLRVPGLGGKVEDHLSVLDLHHAMIRSAMAGDLTAQSFGRLLKAIKDYPNYQRGLYKRALESGHDVLAAQVAAHVLKSADDPFFAKRLSELAERGIIPKRSVVTAAE